LDIAVCGAGSSQILSAERLVIAGARDFSVHLPRRQGSRSIPRLGTAWKCSDVNILEQKTGVQPYKKRRMRHLNASNAELAG
jgi:hypothetical protein